MAVEHEASSATGALQGRHRLEPSRLNFLQLYLISSRRQVARDPAGDGGLFPDEAGDTNESLAQIDQFSLVDVLQCFLLRGLIDHPSFLVRYAFAHRKPALSLRKPPTAARYA